MSALPLLLLHNGFDSKITWQPVLPHLLPSTRALAFNRSGYGEHFELSQNPESINIVEQGYTDLVNFIDQHLADQAQLNLWGHCVGGAIALLYAARHPQKVGAVCGEAVGFFSSPQLSQHSQWLLSDYQDMPLAFRQHFESMHGADRAASAWQRLRAHSSSYIMNPEYSILEKISAVSCPVLLLQGSRDVYFNGQHLARGAAALSRAAVQVLEIRGGSHDLHSQDPEGISRLVLEFLSQP